MALKMCKNINGHKTRRRMSPLGAYTAYTSADLSYSGFYIISTVLVSILKIVTRSHVGCFFFQEIAVFFRISLQRWILGHFYPHCSRRIFQSSWLRMLGSVRVHCGDLHCKCDIVGTVYADPGVGKLCAVNEGGRVKLLKQK